MRCSRGDAGVGERDLWTQWGRERMGLIDQLWEHVLCHAKQTAGGICCVTRDLRSGLCDRVGWGRLRREGHDACG